MTRIDGDGFLTCSRCRSISATERVAFNACVKTELITHTPLVTLQITASDRTGYRYAGKSHATGGLLKATVAAEHKTVNVAANKTDATRQPKRERCAAALAMKPTGGDGCGAIPPAET